MKVEQVNQWIDKVSRKFKISPMHGRYQGYIEQIGTGRRKEKRFAGITLPVTKDSLYISNMPSYWILSLFTGYEQLGIVKIETPHDFNEREYVDLIYEDGIIIELNKRK